MFTLLRLAVRLFKAALLIGVVAYGVVILSRWKGNLNVSEAVEILQNKLEWLIELVGKLK